MATFRSLKLGKIQESFAMKSKVKLRVKTIIQLYEPVSHYCSIYWSSIKSSIILIK